MLKVTMIYSKKESPEKILVWLLKFKTENAYKAWEFGRSLFEKAYIVRNIVIH